MTNNLEYGYDNYHTDPSRSISEKDFPHRTQLWKLERRSKNQIAAHARKSSTGPFNNESFSKTFQVQENCLSYYTELHSA